MPTKLSSTTLKCPKCKRGQLIERKIKTGDRAGQTFFGCNQFYGSGDDRNCDYTQKQKNPSLNISQSL